MKRENQEFIDLFNASGWSKAEAGRRLHKNRASVGRYITGEIPPEPVVLELFKMILGCEKPEVLTTSGALMDRAVLEDQLVFKLEELKRADPEAYEVAKSNILLLHNRLSRKIYQREGSSVSYRKGKKAGPPKSAVDQVADDAGIQAVDDLPEDPEVGKS